MPIQTEVKPLGANEHSVHVNIPDAEYQKAYAGQMKKLSRKVKLPGFRPGRTPTDVIEQKFGGQVRQDTIDQLIRDHYVEALESSGLTPAMQPVVEVPQEPDAEGLNFTLKVVTWPRVELADLRRLNIQALQVEVGDDDVREALDRLVAEQVSYQDRADYAAREGDALRIDFTGFIGDEPFDGGRGENLRMILGEGRFIPGFEEGLLGSRAGEERTVSAKFPDDYGHEELAGMQARFEVVVRSVAQARKAASVEELATFLGFDSVDALERDVRKRLLNEAENANRVMNREAVYGALLAAHDISLPEALVADAMKKNVKRVARQLKAQGGKLTEEMIGEEGFQAGLRERSERELRLSILISAIRQEGGLSVEEADVNARVEAMAERYPAAEREAFMRWFYQQESELEDLRDDIMQAKCVDYVLAQAGAERVKKNLAAWRASQQEAAGGREAEQKQEAA